MEALAHHLSALRTSHGWSLDETTQRTGVSRASLARIEKAQVSPTAETLGKLCAAYGMTMSRLLTMVEDSFEPVVSADQAAVWKDPATGFERRMLSPATGPLAGEVLSCHLPSDQMIRYDTPPRAGLEHHLIVKSGTLCVTVEDTEHVLRTGDCLRYQLRGPSQFATTAESADYLLFLI